MYETTSLKWVRGITVLTSVTLEMNGVYKTESKGVLYQNYTLVDNGVCWGDIH